MEIIQQASGNLKKCDNLWNLGKLLRLQIFNVILGRDRQSPHSSSQHSLWQKTFPAQGWPQMDEDRNYLGPFPAACSHQFHVKKLIGKKNGKWKTADSAAYPPPLCKWLAQLIVSRKGENTSELGKPSDLSECAEQVDPPEEACQYSGQDTSTGDTCMDAQVANQVATHGLGPQWHRGQKSTWNGLANQGNWWMVSDCAHQHRGNHQAEVHI